MLAVFAVLTQKVVAGGDGVELITITYYYFQPCSDRTDWTDRWRTFCFLSYNPLVFISIYSYIFIVLVLCEQLLKYINSFFDRA